MLLAFTNGSAQGSEWPQMHEAPAEELPAELAEEIAHLRLSVQHAVSSTLLLWSRTGIRQPLGGETSGG